jgi:hypothetical protein
MGVKPPVSFTIYFISNHICSKHYSKVNCCLILMKYLPTNARTYLLFCAYFKIFLWSTELKYSRIKHKDKLFVFRSIIIVSCFWRSKFSFMFNSWILKILKIIKLCWYYSVKLMFWNVVLYKIYSKKITVTEYF